MIRKILGIAGLVGSIAACDPGLPKVTFDNSTAVPTHMEGESEAVGVATQPVTLTASDGVKVYGDYYAAQNPKALILLFHQAGSSAAEYATIAPRLVENGYSALAIDQRSGGDLFGPNRTMASAGLVPQGDAGYIATKPDLQAALNWAGDKNLPIILWGSSYSSTLVFLVAAENPGQVKAVLSFSPGEYLGGERTVRDAATKVDVPIYVTSAKTDDEINAAQQIFDAAPGKHNTRFVPEKGGVHGSSTLIAAKDPKGAEENWNAVLAFLKRVVG